MEPQPSLQSCAFQLSFPQSRRTSFEDTAVQQDQCARHLVSEHPETFFCSDQINTAAEPAGRRNASPLQTSHLSLEIQGPDQGPHTARIIAPSPAEVIRASRHTRHR